MKTFCRSTANPQRERYVARSGCLFKAHMHEHSLKSILQSAKYSCVKSIEEANLMFTLNSLGDSDTELCGLVQKPNRSFNTLLSQHTNNLATCNNKKINNKLAEKLNFIWTELFLSHCNENVLHSLVASQKILYFFFQVLKLSHCIRKWQQLFYYVVFCCCCCCYGYHNRQKFISLSPTGNCDGVPLLWKAENERWHGFAASLAMVGASLRFEIAFYPPESPPKAFIVL